MFSEEIGFLLLVVAGSMNASFTLPMKFTRHWSWENTWLVWTFFTLLLLPAIVTLLTIPELAQVYRTAGFTPILCVMTFGAGWGLSQVFFGVAVEAIGIALTFSLVLGTSAALGALIPLLNFNPGRVNTPAGHAVLLGIGVVFTGVAICAIAGKMRGAAAITVADHERRGITRGLILAVLCGCGASFMNFGVAFGTPLTEAASRYGARMVNAGNAVWLPLLGAGAVPNLLYCIYLLKKNSSGDRFQRSGVGHWILALVMAVCWFGSVLLYGVAISLFGPLGTTVGWPVFMSFIVIAASLLGILTGEWRGSGRWPLAIQLIGVATLVVAVLILAKASRL